MRVAYLVLLHRDPELLSRTIRILGEDDAGIFVHVDKKATAEAFRRLPTGSAVFCEPREPVYWSEFSQIRATRLLVRSALASAESYDYLVFIQGSTYPLRSGRYIREFLQSHRGDEFMNLVRMPAPGYPMSKMNVVRYPSDQPVHRFAARALAKIGLARRDFHRQFPDLQPYSGHAAWALSRAACEYILDFDASHPEVARYFERVFVPEESFFHTIIGNSAFANRVRRNVVYADWSTSDGHHPAALDATHISWFEQQDAVRVDDEWGAGEMLFARKLSDDRRDLLDRIDRMIADKERSPETDDGRRDAVATSECRESGTWS